MEKDTPEGLRRKEVHRYPQTIVVSPLVAAGTSLTSEETISNLYVMNKPGVYFVSVEEAVADEEGTDYIKSNTLRITIR